MVTEIFALTFLLTVGNLAHCQDWENRLLIKIEELMAKQEAALMKQEVAMSQLKEMQEKQEHFEGQLQGISAKLETLEGIHREPKDCLGKEELEHFKNISLSGQQELESSLCQKISGVISLLETGGIDECSEGSHNCSDHEFCTDKFVLFTCTCLSGFTRNGSRCEDIDECAQGKDECSPHATCRNSVGSYSCSCNPPFEGDGRTCVPEFPCKSPAKVVEGVGCVKLVDVEKTFEALKTFCHQTGGRLLYDLSQANLQEVRRVFPYSGLWIGVHEGRWQESGLPLQEELWTEDSWGLGPSGMRGQCGAVFWDRPSSLYKIGHRECSEKRFGYCLFVTPQK